MIIVVAKVKLIIKTKVSSDQRSSAGEVLLEEW